MFSKCSCMQTLLARSLEYLLTELDQTFITNGLWGKDERVKFSGQKAKGQGQGQGQGQNQICHKHALFSLVSKIFRVLVVTCWQRHNSRQSRNQHLLLLLLHLAVCDCARKRLSFSDKKFGARNAQQSSTKSLMKVSSSLSAHDVYRWSRKKCHWIYRSCSHRTRWN